MLHGSFVPSPAISKYKMSRGSTVLRISRSHGSLRCLSSASSPCHCISVLYILSLRMGTSVVMAAVANLQSMHDGSVSCALEVIDLCMHFHSLYKVPVIRGMFSRFSMFGKCGTAAYSIILGAIYLRKAQRGS